MSKKRNNQYKVVNKTSEYNEESGNSFKIYGFLKPVNR